MEEKCKSCSIDDVGCGVIKQLRKEVLKIKVHRSYLHIIALFICVLGLFVAGLFAFRTFCPAPSAKNVVYNIKISGEKNISGDVKAEIKKELAEALIEVENRAVAAYNEKFTILLTVLTIFGIAWPVIIQMLQFKFNEKELEKIEIAKKQADDSLQTATSAVKNAQDSIKVLLTQYHSQIYYDMGLDKRQTNPGSFGIFNHYFALSLEFKLRSFMLDDRNIAENSITRILSEFDFSQPNSDKNIKCRNTLTTCKALAEEIRRNAIGTVREKEAEKVWLAVKNKYDQFGGSPIDGEDD